MVAVVTLLVAVSVDTGLVIVRGVPQCKDFVQLNIMGQK